MTMGEMKGLKALTKDVRVLLRCGLTEDARCKIAQAMAIAPDAAQPHNLMGILLEQINDHEDAMKHFRAAWALDPTYAPAQLNLERYGEITNAPVSPIFDETDCPRNTRLFFGGCRIEYDRNGVGHAVKG